MRCRSPYLILWPMVVLLGANFSQELSAQDPLDSLWQAYQAHEPDTHKLRTINNLVNAYLYREPAKALELIDEGLTLSQALAFETGLCLFYYQKGVYYYLDADSSRYYYDRALEIALKIKDTRRQAAIQYGLALVYFDEGKLDTALQLVEANLELDRLNRDTLGIALSYGFIGNLRRNQGYFQLAMQAIHQSLSMLLEVGDEMRIGDAYNTLGALEANLDHYEQVIQYNREALRRYRKLKDISFEAVALHDIGVGFLKLGQLDSAYAYLSLGQQLAEQVNLITVYINSLQNLGKWALLSGNEQEAERQYQAALELAQEKGYQRRVAIIQTSLGALYHQTKQSAKALPLLTASIAYGKEANSLNTLRDSYQHRSRAYEQLGLPQKALADFQSFQTLSDSLISQTQVRQIEEMRILFQTKQKEAQIEQLAAEVRESKLRKGLYGTGIVALLAILVLVWSYMQWRNQRTRERQRQQQRFFEQELAFKQKELVSQAVHLAAKQSFVQEVDAALDAVKDSPETLAQTHRRLKGLMAIESDADKNWSVFKAQFAEVHGDFDRSLKTEYPDLTESELRLASLLKINLSTKEIAAVLNVLPDSVLKSKYRLKKKLRLEKSVNLTDFLAEYGSKRVSNQGVI